MTIKVQVKVADLMLWFVTGCLHVMLLVILAFALYTIGVGTGVLR